MNETIQRIKSKLQRENTPLNDPISIDEIRRYEQRFEWSLPEELVLFYTKIGNGCTMIDGFPLKGLHQLVFNESKAKESFPFTRHWIWEDDETPELLDQVPCGNLELINLGDSQSWNIIIAGEEKGQMWFFTDVGMQPCAPRCSFLAWFEQWLDGNDRYFEEFK
ncbi:SMI1/KNR4 family protein [Gorillibacterium sp. CAU 1737]|uniref:SMI1/KNR4 family protein n=1 Tax=Gorillibacterium sp. CAU 1737 TaxID=3140362 RepID=UPI0032605AE0